MVMSGAVKRGVAAKRGNGDITMPLHGWWWTMIHTHIMRNDDVAHKRYTPPDHHLV